jgi:hypothetical protein
MEYKTNKITGMITETNYVLNWFKIFDFDGFLVMQGEIK